MPMETSSSNNRETIKSNELITAEKIINKVNNIFKEAENSPFLKIQELTPNDKSKSDVVTLFGSMVAAKLDSTFEWRPHFLSFNLFGTVLINNEGKDICLELDQGDLGEGKYENHITLFIGNSRNSNNIFEIAKNAKKIENVDPKTIKLVADTFGL